jgi:hypothetical protein
MDSLLAKIERRAHGIALYGISPPKLSTEPASLAAIVEQQAARFRALGPDGLVLYDIQDESDRTSAPRPFPFLPTLSPEQYAFTHLADVDVAKVVYRSVPETSPAAFVAWLEGVRASGRPELSVLVGAPKKREGAHRLDLRDAYALAREHAPDLVLGGIAIAERHPRDHTEHVRMIDKMDRGCRFFVTQAVYDASTTKSMLSDYAHALAEQGRAPAPVVLTFSPCGSVKTLELMKWLGISFPRWLENDLRRAPDPLATSLRLCEQIHADVDAFAREKGIPLGFNVESVSIRRAEIDASVALFEALSRRVLATAVERGPAGG